MLRDAARGLAEDLSADAAGKPRPQRPPLKLARLVDDPAEIEAMEQERDRREQARRDAEWNAYLATLEGRPIRPSASPTFPLPILPTT